MKTTKLNTMKSKINEHLFCQITKVSKKTLLFAALFAVSITTFAQVGVGTTDPKAALDVVSTASGFIMPRVTDHTTLTVGADQEGMQVYNTTTKTIWCWNGTSWFECGAMQSNGNKWNNTVGIDTESSFVSLLNLSDGSTLRSENNLFKISDEGHVGIGTDPHPFYKLTLKNYNSDGSNSSNGENSIFIQAPTDKVAGVVYGNDSGYFRTSLQAGKFVLRDQGPLDPLTSTRTDGNVIQIERASARFVTENSFYVDSAGQVAIGLGVDELSPGVPGTREAIPVLTQNITIDADNEAILIKNLAGTGNYLSIDNTGNLTRTQSTSDLFTLNTTQSSIFLNKDSNGDPRDQSREFVISDNGTGGLGIGFYDNATEFPVATLDLRNNNNLGKITLADWNTASINSQQLGNIIRMTDTDGSVAGFGQAMGTIEFYTNDSDVTSGLRAYIQGFNRGDNNLGSIRLGASDISFRTSSIDVSGIYSDTETLYFSDKGMIIGSLGSGLAARDNSSDTADAMLQVNGYIKLGSTDATADPNGDGTSAALMPGMMRYNATTDKFQGYVANDGTGSAGWVDLH